MSEKVNKPSDNKAKMHVFMDKFRAWWNGVDYVPAETQTDDDVFGKKTTKINSVPAEDTEEKSDKVENLTTDAEIKPEENTNEENSETDGGAAEEIKDSKTDEIDNATLDKIAGEYSYVPDNEHMEENAYFIAEKIFGQGRISPTDGEVDKAIIANMPFTEDENGKQKLTLFGVEAAATIYAWLNRYDLEIEAYETNKFLIEKTKSFLDEKGLGNKIKFKNFDNTPKTVPKNRASQLLVYNQGINLEKFEATCSSIARILTPDGRAVWVDYFAKDGCADIANDDVHGRSFAYESEIQPLMDANGIKIIEEDDISVHLLNSYYARKNRMLENWEIIQRELIAHGGIDIAGQALNLTMAWKKRIEAIRHGELFLKRLIIELD